MIVKLKLGAVVVLSQVKQATIAYAGSEAYQTAIEQARKVYLMKTKVNHLKLFFTSLLCMPMKMDKKKFALNRLQLQYVQIM